MLKRIVALHVGGKGMTAFLQAIVAYFTACLYGRSLLGI